MAHSHVDPGSGSSAWCVWWRCSSRAGGYAWARAHTTPQVYGGATTVNDMLWKVTVDPSGGAWAIGARYGSLTGASALRDTFILHRQGGQWVVSEMLDATGGEIITAIAMVSPTEGWAVGSVGATNTLILHYQHSQWSALPEHPRGQLDAIAMVSPDDGWAVGSTIDGASIMMHYSHGAWASVNVPQVGGLGSITMSSADAGWAAGASILRYANGVWTADPFTLQRGQFISGLAAPTADVAWASGNTLLRYANGAWAVVGGPTGATTDGISMTSATDGWAVGDLTTRTSVLWHYTNGAWTATQSPTQQPLQSVAMASASEGWAVGEKGVILHYANGVWTRENGSA